MDKLIVSELILWLVGLLTHESSPFHFAIIGQALDNRFLQKNAFGIQKLIQTTFTHVTL